MHKVPEETDSAEKKRSFRPEEDGKRKEKRSGYVRGEGTIHAKHLSYHAWREGDRYLS